MFVMRRPTESSTVKANFWYLKMRLKKEHSKSHCSKYWADPPFHCISRDRLNVDETSMGGRPHSGNLAEPESFLVKSWITPGSLVLASHLSSRWMQASQKPRCLSEREDSKASLQSFWWVTIIPEQNRLKEELSLKGAQNREDGSEDYRSERFPFAAIMLTESTTSLGKKQRRRIPSS